MDRKNIYGWIALLAALLAACEPEATTSSMPTESVAPVAPPTPSLVAPTAKPSAAIIEPLMTAPMLRVGRWSPDGEWLTYWTFTDEEAAAGYTLPPGTLHFLNARTGQTCAYEGDAAHGYDGESVTWQPDGKVLISENGKRRAGAPCTEFAAADDVPTPVPADPNTASSPGGTYQARTDAIREADFTFSAVTTIAETMAGRVIDVIEWTHRGGKGDLGLGGQWLTDDRFLIRETLDRGPLLVTVGQGVVEVAPELFGVPSVPVPIEVEDEVEWYAWGAFAATLPGDDIYHIALSATGFEAHFPPVRLYHSETSEVEELPFKYLWARGFTEDGRWILLDGRPIVDGYESYALWFRSVDPVGGEARLLAANIEPYVVWSPDLTQVALNMDARVVVYSFPAAIELGVWDTGQYEGSPMAWSPDGEQLAVYGYMPGRPQEALFVIPMP